VRSGWELAVHQRLVAARRVESKLRTRNFFPRIALCINLEQEWTMPLILILIVLIVLFGGGGFYAGAPYHYYGGGLSVVLIIVLVVLLLRR
jgi:hypothetical protein